MRNWLGQNIEPGVVVYRGARQGNTSEYKIGVVESVDEVKGIARVAWKYGPGRPWRNLNGHHERLDVSIPAAMDSKGSPAIDGLVTIDPRVIEKCAQALYFVRQWQDGSMPEHVLRQALDSILGT